MKYYLRLLRVTYGNHISYDVISASKSKDMPSLGGAPGDYGGGDYGGDL